MNAHPDTPTDINPPPSDWLGRAGVLLAAAVLVAFRMHAFDLPLETDEANYAYVGARLLESNRLYVDVWDHQPFGVFVLFAGVIRFFGDAPEVFRWLATVFSLASMWLIFRILRVAAGSAVGVFGAMLFAIVSADPGTAGEGCNREIYMNAFILAAWYLAARTSGTRGSTRAIRGSALLAAGVSLAIASAIKMVVAVHWLALVVWVVFWSGRVQTTRDRVRAVLLLATGPVVLWAGSFAYFAGTDRLEAFTDAVFVFNLSYSDTNHGLLMRFADFFTPQHHPYTFTSALPLWWLGGVGTVWLVLRAWVIRPRHGAPADSTDGTESTDTHDVSRASASALALLVVASFVAVCLPGRFWPHYYYLMLPPLVLATAATFGHAMKYACAKTKAVPRWACGAGQVALFGAIAGSLLWTQYRDYLSQPPLGITIKRYNTRDFWGRAHGLNIKSVTEPGDTIFVYSNDAAIYYYAQRRCASRYTMITGIADGMEGAEHRRRSLMKELRAKPPRLIVVAFGQKPFSEWNRFLHEYYGQPVGWDFNDTTGEPIMFVLALKDQPIRKINWNWDRSMISGPETDH